MLMSFSFIFFFSNLCFFSFPTFVFLVRLIHSIYSFHVVFVSSFFFFLFFYFFFIYINIYIPVHIQYVHSSVALVYMSFTHTYECSTPLDKYLGWYLLDVQREKLISLSNQTVMVTSLQLLQTCVDSSQSHRQPRTYFPGLILSGISTLSIISTWSFHSPEHLQVPGGGAVVWEFLHSSFSSHTGSKLVPYFIHALGARGIGFLRQLEPAGVVPSLVSQPKRIKVQIKWKKGKKKKTESKKKKEKMN